MTEFQTDIHIDAPPDVVWAVIRDVERWPEWTPTVTSLRLQTPGTLTLGNSAFIRQPKLPPAKWRVTEIDDRARSFTWVSTGVGVQVTARHSAESSGAGTRAKLSLQFTGMLASLAGKFLGGLNDRYLALEAKGLKERSERLKS